MNNASVLYRGMAGPAVQRRLLPQTLTLASAVLVPLYLSMFRFNVGGVLVRLADLIAIGVVLGTLLTAPAALLRAARRPTFLLMAVLMGYVVIQGSFLHLSNMHMVKEAVQLGLVATVVAMIGIHAERDPELFLRAFVVASVISMGYTLAYHISRGYYVRYKFAEDARYIFGVTSVLLLLAWRQHGWRGWLGPAFFLSLPPLVASFERKGLFGVALIVTLLVSAHLLRRLRVNASIAIFLFVLPLCACGIFFADQIADRFDDAIKGVYFNDEAETLYTSNEHRTALLVNGWDIFSKHSWFGTGADTLREQMRAYFIDRRLANGTHNFYLDNMIKYGAIGAGLFFAAIAFGTWETLRAAQARATAALFAGYLLFVVAFISDGEAVTILALLPTVVGVMFEARRSPAKATTSRTPIGAVA